MKMEKDLGNLLINGYGSSNGGQFDNVTINGKGTINGAIECHTLECNGMSTINGDIKGENVRVSGNAKITGKVMTENLIVEGRATITNEVNMGNFSVAGTTTVGGNVKGEEMKVQGRVTIGGDCEVESFHSEGQFSIDGLLSAELIDIYTYGECKVREIGGQTIKVKQKTNFLLDMIKNVKSVKLSVELIEGDDIFLENTKAKIVRGNNIVVGADCEIDLVEYKETYHIQGNGRVLKSVQI
jgi:cytoskeletal protein CcmA (bactofilin family)